MSPIYPLRSNPRYIRLVEPVYVPPPDVEPDDPLAIDPAEIPFAQWLIFGIGMFWLGVAAYWAFERAMR